LDGKSNKMVYIPEGFAHGFSLEAAYSLINVLQDIIRNQRRYNLERSSIE
jgi:dTDP-4-dehydrorhamnose 3,5-epimerase-like enzyme